MCIISTEMIFFKIRGSTFNVQVPARHIMNTLGNLQAY